jgi:predicted ribonuclease YlaK
VATPQEGGAWVARQQRPLASRIKIRWPNFMRGRLLSRFVIVGEAQNLTPSR